MLKKIFYIGFVLNAAVLSWAEENPKKEAQVPIQFEARRHTQDLKNQIITLEGGVTIRYGTSELHAQKVILEKQKFEFFAEGDVHLSIPSEQTLIKAHELRLNYHEETGEMVNAHIQSGYSVLNAKKVFKLGPRQYRVHNATYTTCDVGIDESCPWKIWFYRGDVIFEGYATAEHPVFLATGVPVFYSPFFFFPVKKERQTGFLMPLFGGSSKSGFQVKLPLFITLGRSQDATPSLEFITKRGFKEGLEYRYALSPLSSGKLDGYVIRDREFYKDFGLRNRYGVSFDQDYYFTDNFFNKASARLISDDEYVKDYENDMVGRVDPGLETKMLQGYFNDAFSVNVEGVYYESLLSDTPEGTNRQVTHKLPEARFALHQADYFKSPFLFSADFSYTNFYNQGGPYLDKDSNSKYEEGKDDLLRAQRTDFFPKVSLPIKFGRYLEFVPQTGFRHTHWFLPVGERNKDRSMMDLASTLQTNVFRIFNVEGTRVKKIKHLIEPRISHHYSPFVKLDALLPNFDGVDSLTSVHTLSWGLQNRLIFKASDAPKTPDDAKSKIKPKKEEMSQKNFIYFDGLRLDLTQDFDFNELYGGRSDPEPWHDLKAILTSTISTFSMNSEADFNMYGDYVTRVSHGMGYSDPWKNIYKMNYTYSLRDESNTINGGIGFNFIDILKFNFNLNYSFDEDIFLEKIFQMTYLPKSHCWALNVDFEDKIDSGMTFNIGLNLLFGGNFLSLAKIYQEGETQNLRLFSGQGSTAP